MNLVKNDVLAVYEPKEAESSCESQILLHLHSFPERCQSGRTSKPGKFVYSQGYRGFESRPLRRRMKQSPAFSRDFSFLTQSVESLFAFNAFGEKENSIAQQGFVSFSKWDSRDHER